MRTVVLATLMMLAFSRRSTAEINMADSIEWATADSDRVVVGKVASLTERKGPGSVTWYRVTIAVSQALKGPADNTVDLMFRHVSGDSPALWRSKNTELIWFLVDWKRRAIRDGECRDGATPSTPCNSDYSAAPFALRYGRWGDSDAVKLDGSGRAYTASFDVIAKRDALIAAVKAAASSKATQAFQLDTPLDSPAGKALWGGSAVWMYVPIDAALEKLAIRWLASKDGSQRDRGVHALSHFKSADNIRRIEAMLADPATHDVTEGTNPPGTAASSPRMIRRFFVRKRAHQVLRAWGVPHTTPPIDSVVNP